MKQGIGWLVWFAVAILASVCVGMVLTAEVLR